MQFRINKENCALLKELKIDSTWWFNKLLNDLLVDYKWCVGSVYTIESNKHITEYNDNLLHMYDLLSLIYKDSQYVVESIKNKKTWHSEKTNSNCERKESEIRSVERKGSEVKEKIPMSVMWWAKWINFKSHRDALGSHTSEWWIEWDDLLNITPYKEIQVNIDSWDFILD